MTLTEDEIIAVPDLPAVEVERCRDCLRAVAEIARQGGLRDEIEGGDA
jgi:hypothetical protein